ncbi:MULTISPECIES: ArsR/SmtB family transcription factor [Clostridium]|jgi:transcriptional regulator, ArsR family|uniref:Winged helix-turn-helix transcriptional regulator n=2 Tax=Clostridium beijerinckii TaxID=1520 RepID=A0AAE2UYM3_CLOBE|nr:MULTISPECIES: metalloregulator ArsR/SmtB family transcription factor [Clostridium]ABR35636.1 regulatory protein, ArsR [Clostridium beijerinckii NCIMB 8052]AIU03539.1 regulatory protein, ArsR [Clostridium beijerinckii ATCC 35702]MBF7809725.1 winged helix-turn-helix transcriptional regulator [Clostridium beijerinckii]NOW90285.1 DNA-binding transcriptional ArsR family regulator [Clostridium beijerinckii]NRT69496.1 DNA-binding transcriptional ArsR family regulator [Clostridium beijerinckii]
MNEQDKLRQLENEFKECRAVLAAIGDETRQLIILSLMKGTYPGIRVGEITKGTHLSRPAVSHHLKILKEAKIVTLVKQGTMNFYHINPAKSDLILMKRLFSHVEEFMCDCWKEN